MSPKERRKRVEKEDHIVFYDTPEEIRKCLKCPYAECTNCQRVKHRKDVIPPFDKSLLEHYVNAPSDSCLAKSLGVSFERVIRHRIKLGIPDPARVDKVDREKIAKEKLGG